MENLDLDVITIGRSSVDLYGNQVGGRLEDMTSFAKYLGGSPTNTAAGASRLGLKSAVITAVGDEHMGRFIIEQLEREGVDTRGVKIDPQRLTALVILGIRDHQTFPPIFSTQAIAGRSLRTSSSCLPTQPSGADKTVTTISSVRRLNRSPRRRGLAVFLMSASIAPL